MPETFIELVPRCDASLRQSMAELEASGIPFDGYNIPEIVTGNQSFLRPEDLLKLKSNGAISEEKKLVLHLRTREHSAEETLDRLQLIARYNVAIALLVTGDPTLQEQGRCTHAHDVLAACSDHPPLPLGVAADIYQPQWGRWQQKKPFLGTTAQSVFTQPIFHPSLLEDIALHTKDALQPEQVYVGITWITTDRSRRYWHERNAVPLTHLPQGGSDAEISGNSIAQAADVLRAAKQQQHSIYIMLMRSTIAQLERVISLSENIREI